MIDWAGVVEHDYTVPGELDACVTELVAMLAEPDPAVRDDLAYRILAAWIERGVLDRQLSALGDSMVERLRHPQVQARTFAPLILTAAIERDAAVEPDTNAPLSDDAVRRWWRAFAEWWPTEPDTRGWDDRLGWLHAIAHGADCRTAASRSRRPRSDDRPAAGART